MDLKIRWSSKMFRNSGTLAFVLMSWSRKMLRLSSTKKKLFLLLNNATLASPVDCLQPIDIQSNSTDTINFPILAGHDHLQPTSTWFLYTNKQSSWSKSNHVIMFSSNGRIITRSLPTFVGYLSRKTCY